MKAAALVALAGLAALPGCAAQRAMVVNAGGVGTKDAPCIVEVEGKRIALNSFLAFARRWNGREARLIGDIHTPYRCVGSIVFALQRARFRRIGFISEPAATPEVTR